MKKLIVTVIILVAVGVGAGAFYLRKNTPDPVVTTLQVTRGDIADVVQATGTLEAVTTVQVGTQVSGIVQELYADYNKIVRKGQVIARMVEPGQTVAASMNAPTLFVLAADLTQMKVNASVDEAEIGRMRPGQTGP